MYTYCILSSDHPLTHEWNGEHVQDGHEYGVIVVLGYGLEKEMTKGLTDNEVEEVEAMMKEVILAPKSDTPQWFRVRRIMRALCNYISPPKPQYFHRISSLAIAIPKDGQR
ncbi:hypothetical protein BDV93DRAFT_505442 [Ceratobasidium sp. AG-I]|nr:hypothetical protein BDV93DRAFT_505442 [Ceratobasidium sp. AG-I]